jgi:urease accessory protein
MFRAVSISRAEDARTAQKPFDSAVLAHDERHLRRKVLELAGGTRVLVDFPQAVALEDHDLLVLEDGRTVEILSASEELLEVRGRDAVHLTELAWHIGNRHLPAAIEAGRILILRDHVIKAMLEGLGATVIDTIERFQPTRGAYSGDGHGHSHGHGHHHHDHDDDHHHHHHHGDHHHHD